MGDILKENGITRKIDELGRIVITKEIRKNLKIRNNDELLINILDDNIILSKYMKFSSDDVLKILVDTISKTINKVVLITSKDKVIVSSDLEYNDLELSNSIINKIENYNTFSSLVPVKINLFKEIMEVSYVVSPFSISFDVFGSVIVFSKNSLDEFSVECVELVKRFLENYLEE